MVNKKSRSEVRVKKHMRVRNHLSGTAERPRLAVFRSNNHMYAQIIDDTAGNTLVAASTLEKDIKAACEKTNNVEAAAKVGEAIAKKALAKGIDTVVMVLSIIGVSAPAFWVAIILQILFGLKLNILPISGFDTPASYILPSLALGARYAGNIARITRTSMLEVLGQDYIRTAKAKGAMRWAVILKHALKNAMIPIVTLVGTDFGYMLTGSMLIEKVFSIPGIGKLAVDAMSNRDLPLLEGTVMYIAFVFVVVNLIVDVSYAFLDPRIRYGKGAA